MVSLCFSKAEVRARSARKMFALKNTRLKKIFTYWDSSRKGSHTRLKRYTAIPDWRVQGFRFMIFGKYLSTLVEKTGKFREKNQFRSVKKCLNIVDIEMLQDEASLISFANIGFDTAENEPSKVCYKGLNFTITLYGFLFHSPGKEFTVNC